ncbi:MAG TPA: PD-(D/E)XK nuclease family protein [Candidatus Acidoferrales bacterium]|jgi:hypothetical protein|nr:PD-(D/E)XK nuclease family protein [Candidatus Acidoferrales bacterium]
MIDAAENDAAKSKQVLTGLLERSAAQEFLGFGDPLDLDFGAHRWLKGAREEAWSHWLAWILDRKGDSGDVLRLFGLAPSLVASTTCEAKREVCTPDGRLDIIVRFGVKTLVVEIKTISEVRQSQLVEYPNWLKTQDDRFDFVLLLAVDEPEEDLPPDWRFCSWETVSMGLRTWASAWLREKRQIEAALTLAFCGAVEQNLLGFGSGLNAPRTAEYLDSWLEAKQR